MILLLFGPPGCGKGTQAVFLAERFHIPAISTGEIIRAEIHSGSARGKTVSEIIGHGDFVSDEMVNQIVAGRISQPDCANGFLLDGYPRTVPQARVLGALLRQRGLPDPMVIHLAIADCSIVARLTARRQCPECKHIYNLLTQPPRVADRCDDCRQLLIHRDDDTEAVVRHRLETYKELTGPVLQWYGPSAIHTVNGDQSLELVRKAVAAALMDATSAMAVGD